MSFQIWADLENLLFDQFLPVSQFPSCDVSEAIEKVMMTLESSTWMTLQSC